MNNNNPKHQHIMYLIDELKVRGGAEKHLYELCVGMSSKGHRVSVFSLLEGPFADEFRKVDALAYSTLDVKRIYSPHGLNKIYEIASYIRQENVDILQTFHTASDLIGPIAACLSMKKILVLSSRRDMGYTKSLRHVMVQRHLNRYIHGILANSSAVKRSVVEQELVPENKVTVIHNGIDIVPFLNILEKRDGSRLRLGLRTGEIAIGSVGNIRNVKGYDLLVEAAGIICRNRPNVRIFQVGDGDLRESLADRCAELGIENQISFLGPTNNVTEFLSALDIYVQPSRSEGLSNAIMEAMAAGIPVVATDVGGNRDLIRDKETGLLVTPEDYEDLAAGLERLIREPILRNKYALAASSYLLEEYQLLGMLDAYENYYLKKILQ